MYMYIDFWSICNCVYTPKACMKKYSINIKIYIDILL